MGLPYSWRNPTHNWDHYDMRVENQLQSVLQRIQMHTLDGCYWNGYTNVFPQCHQLASSEKCGL